MRGLIFGLVGLVLVVVTAVGQEEKSWSVKTELGASVFFGNTSQSAVTTSISGDLERGVFDLVGRAGSVYGEASTDDGDTFVNKRAWDVGLDVKYDAGSALNGFVRDKVESILENKIYLRYNIGVGGRYQS